MDASQRGGWASYSSPQLLAQLQAARGQQWPSPMTASSPVLALSSSVFSSTAQILCPTPPVASMHQDAFPHPRRYSCVSSIRPQGQEKHSEAMSAIRTKIASIEEAVHLWKMQLFTRDPELSLDTAKGQLRAHSATIHDIAIQKLPDLEKQSPLRASGQLASQSFAKIQRLYQQCFLLQKDIDLLRCVAESPHYKEVQKQCAEWRIICTTIETFKNLHAIATTACKFFAGQESVLDRTAFDKELVALIRWEIRDMKQLFLHHIKRFTSTDKTRALIQTLSPQDAPSVESLAQAVASLSLASSTSTSAAACAVVASPAPAPAPAPAPVLALASASATTHSLPAPSGSLPKEEYTRRFSTITLENPYMYQQGGCAPRVGHYFWLGPNQVVWKMENEVAKGLQMLNQDLLHLLQSVSSHPPMRDTKLKVSEKMTLYKEVCRDLEEKLKTFLGNVAYTTEFAEIQKYAGQLRLHIRDIRQKIAFLEHAFDSWDLDDTYAFFAELHLFLTVENETDRLKALYKLIRLEEKLSSKKPCSQTILEFISYFGGPLVARKDTDNALLQAYITGAVSTKERLTDDEQAFLLRSMIRLLYFAPEAQDELFYVAVFTLEKTRAFHQSFSEDADFKEILRFFKEKNAYSSLNEVFDLFAITCRLLYQLEEPVTESTRSIRQIVDMHRFCQLHQALIDVDTFLQKARRDAMQVETEIHQKTNQLHQYEEQIRASRERLAHIDEEKTQALSQRHASEPQMQQAQQRLATLTKELLELQQVVKKISLSTAVETSTVELGDGAQLRLRQESLQAYTAQQKEKSTQKQRTEQEAGQLKRTLDVIEAQLQKKIQEEENELGIIRQNEQQMTILQGDIDECISRKRQWPLFVEHLYKGAYERYAQFQYLPKSVQTTDANLYTFLMQLLFSQDTQVQEHARGQLEPIPQQNISDLNAPLLKHLLRVFSLEQYLKKGSTACTPVQSYFLVHFLQEYVTNPSYFDAYCTLFDVERIEGILYQVFTNDTFWQVVRANGSNDPKIAFQDAVIRARQGYLESWKSLMSAYNTFMTTIGLDQDVSVKKTQCEKLLANAKSIDPQGVAQFTQIHTACVKRMQQVFNETFPASQ